MRNLCVLLLCAALAACSKVPAGNVGVKVFLLGGSKGVDTQELTPGRYWIGFNEELFLFPTFTQNYTWTKEPIDDDDTDESISFQTIEGMKVNADIGISYRVNPEKVNTLFVKYRKGIDEITDVYLRNIVRDALVTAASNRPIESVYGEGKARLLEEALASVIAQTENIGILVEKLYWAGDLRLPEAVTGSLNAKIQATQMAQQRRNEVEQAKAEADKQIAAAHGEAESRLAVARADAEAIRLKGDALRENPQLLELSAIEKWNGTMPSVTGGGIPFVSIPAK